MPKVILCGHDYIYAICDVARMYCERVHVFESTVIGGDDGLPIYSIIENDYVLTKWEQNGICHEINEPIIKNNAKREVKRQIYQAFVSITGISFPWGSLTGIRPTLVASECKNNPSRLTDYYFVSGEKAALAMETCIQEELIQSKLSPGLIHCYIGIPFCNTRCLYCSFVSEEYQQLKKWIPGYVDALIKEVTSCLPPVESRLQSLYIGGGTPTSLPDDLFEKLLQAVGENINGGYFTEFTLEAGRADSITIKKLEIMKKYGVNRLCINPQTMQNKTLQRIGRNHTAEQVRDAYSLARKFDFKTINMDLIAGLPGEKFVDFKNSLDELISLAPENITIHTLSLKRTSGLTKMLKEEDRNETKYLKIQNFHKPNKEISDMIEYSINELNKNGYHPYYLYRQKDMAGGHENVGYSKNGHECLYNVAMMGDKNSVMALGAGAISKKMIFNEAGIHMERFPNLKDISSYLSRIEELITKKLMFFELENKN